jgi:hypothetical protein
MAKRRAGSQTASLTPDEKKSRIDPKYLSTNDVPIWKALDESYNFASDRASIRGLLVKLWGFKVWGVP